MSRGRPALARLTLALAAAAAAAGLAGCHPRRPPADLSADPAELLAAVRAAQARVRAVEGRARVAVEAPQGAGSVDQYLAAEKPARVRIESYDFFGNVLSVLAVDGGDLFLYDAREKVLYRGPATPWNVGRFLPVTMSPEELATLLCGSAPLLADARPEAAAPGDGVMVLTLRLGPLSQVLDVGAGATVRAARLWTDGKDGPTAVGQQVALSSFKDRGGVALPTEATLRAPQARVSVALRWKELAANGALDPGLFRLDPPKGARVVDLDDGAP